MKCPKCEENLKIAVGAKALCEGCNVLTHITSIVTIQCQKCGHVFQVPVESKSFLNVKKA
jgi:RNase P subunit RPR2